MNMYDYNLLKTIIHKLFKKLRSPTTLIERSINEYANNLVIDYLNDLNSIILILNNQEGTRINQISNIIDL